MQILTFKDYTLFFIPVIYLSLFTNINMKTIAVEHPEIIVIITSGSVTYIDPPQLDGHFIYRKYNRLDYNILYIIVTMCEALIYTYYVVRININLF